MHAALLSLSFPSIAATLVIHVEEASTPQPIYAALHSTLSDNWSHKPLATQQSTNAKLIFENVPVGHYAIQTFQDTNDNAKLDSSRRGIPREPVGLSTNPSLTRGKPEISCCWIEVTEPVTETSIRLVSP